MLKFRNNAVVAYMGNNIVTQMNFGDDVKLTKGVLTATRNTGYDYDTRTFSANAILEFKSICTKITGGMGYLGDLPGTIYPYLQILFVNIFTNELEYYFTIYIRSSSGSTNKWRTMLSDKNNNTLASGDWDANYDVGYYYTLFEYDFTNKKYIFKYCSNGTSTNPTINSYEISSTLKPLYVQFINRTSRNDVRFVLNAIGVEGIVNNQ